MNNTAGGHAANASESDMPQCPRHMPKIQSTEPPLTAGGKIAVPGVVARQCCACARAVMCIPLNIPSILYALFAPTRTRTRTRTLHPAGRHHLHLGTIGVGMSRSC